jgi:DNA-binding response OmpR family regulator
MSPAGARALVMTAEPDDEPLVAVLHHAGYEIRVVSPTASLLETAEFAPDVVIVALGESDRLATVRAAVRLLAFAGAEERELGVRTRRLLASIAESGPLEHDDIVIDLERQVAFRGDHELALTSTEMALLALLVRDRNVIRTKPDLLEEIWGPTASNVNVVEVHVSALRRKLERWGPRTIHTVRGNGYIFETLERSRPHEAEPEQHGG